MLQNLNTVHKGPLRISYLSKISKEHFLFPLHIFRSFSHFLFHSEHFLKLITCQEEQQPLLKILLKEQRQLIMLKNNEKGARYMKEQVAIFQSWAIKQVTNFTKRLSFRKVSVHFLTRFLDKNRKQTGFQKSAVIFGFKSNISGLPRRNFLISPLFLWHLQSIPQWLESCTLKMYFLTVFLQDLILIDIF